MNTKVASMIIIGLFGLPIVARADVFTLSVVSENFFSSNEVEFRDQDIGNKSGLSHPVLNGRVYRATVFAKAWLTNSLVDIVGQEIDSTNSFDVQLRLNGPEGGSAKFEIIPDANWSWDLEVFPPDLDPSDFTGSTSLKTFQKLVLNVNGSNVYSASPEQEEFSFTHSTRYIDQVLSQGHNQGVKVTIPVGGTLRLTGQIDAKASVSNPDRPAQAIGFALLGMNVFSAGVVPVPEPPTMLLLLAALGALSLWQCRRHSRFGHRI